VGDGVSWGPPPGPPPGTPPDPSAAPAGHSPADDYFSLGPPLPPQSLEAGAPGAASMGSTGSDCDASAATHSGRRRAVRPLVIAALAVGVLTVVGVSVSAAEGGPNSRPAATTASTTPSNTAPTPGSRNGFRGHGFGPGGPAWAGGLAGPGGGVLHGEFVRRNGNGYQTVDVQVGQVTAVSSSSITVNSSDQFKKTYSVTTNTLVNAGRDGIGTVKVNDNVSVQAVVNGTTTEAANIVDLTSLGNIHQHWRPAPPPSASAPSGSAPATPSPSTP